MKTPSLIKNAIYSALVFFGTLFVLSVGYATFTALQSSDAGPGKSLTSTMMQTVIGNLSDLDSRVSGVTTSLSTLSGAVSSLQSVTGGIWSSGGGSIYYNTGNVGIGATNPNSLLHIYKSSGNNAEIDIQSVAGALKHWGIYQDRASESLRFWNSTAGGDLTTFTNDGKVGIGTSSPSTKLEVAGEVKSTNLTLTDTNSQSTSLGALRITGTNGAIVLDDGGQKRISWNDAGGNFNIRSGNYYQTGVGVSYAKGILDNNGGAAVISMGSDGNDGAISLKTAPIGTPGNLITWGNQFTLGTGYTLFDMSTATGAYFYVKWGRSYFVANNEPYGIASVYNEGGGRVYFWASDGTTVPSAVISNNAGSALMTLQDGGNVGIGISSPTQKLEVAGTVKATAFVGDGSGLTGVGGGVPAGAVFHFAMSACPNGYLKANGAAVSRTTYSALFTAIGTTFGAGDGSTTFNIPELRGEFIRSLDDGRLVDSGRTLGSAQAGSVESHSHMTDGTNGGNKTPVYYGADATFDAHSNYASASDAWYITWSKTGTYGGTETRSRNVALLACIKY